MRIAIFWMLMLPFPWRKKNPPRRCVKLETHWKRRGEPPTARGTYP